MRYRLRMEAKLSVRKDRVRGAVTRSRRRVEKSAPSGQHLLREPLLAFLDVLVQEKRHITDDKS